MIRIKEEPGRDPAKERVIQEAVLVSKTPEVKPTHISPSPYVKAGGTPRQISFRDYLTMQTHEDAVKIDFTSIPR